MNNSSWRKRSFWHNDEVNYRAIISDAWELTQKNKQLIWGFAFVPALINTLVFVGYATYQGFAIHRSPLFSDSASEASDQLWTLILDKAVTFFENHIGLSVAIIVLAAVLGIIYLFIPVFTQGALIQLIAKSRVSGQRPSVMEGIGLGFRRFLQLFEYHLAIKTFSVVSIFTNAIFVLRSFGPEAFALFGWIFLIVFIVGLILTLLFTYTEYYIAIDDRGMFKGMISSIQLVMLNWHHTLFMLILMAIISVRIIFNILVSLLVPFLIIGPILFFTSIALVKIGIVIGGLLGIVALYFASYFLGVFNVFSIAVWTFTYLELTANKSESLRDELNVLEQSHHNEEQTENHEA